MATAAVSRRLWLLHLRARNVSSASTSYQSTSTSTPGSLITDAVAASNLEFRCCRRSSRHLDVAAFRSRFLSSLPSSLPSHCLSVRSISSTRVLFHFLLVATSCGKKKTERRERGKTITSIFLYPLRSTCVCDTRTHALPSLTYVSTRVARGRSKDEAHGAEGKRGRQGCESTSRGAPKPPTHTADATTVAIAAAAAATTADAAATAAAAATPGAARLWVSD